MRATANPGRDIVRNDTTICDTARHPATTASSFAEQRRAVSANDAIIQSALVSASPHEIRDVCVQHAVGNHTVDRFTPDTSTIAFTMMSSVCTRGAVAE